jgi:sensor histidine kinase YesM
MPLQHLIFSETKSGRIWRHLLFWAVWGGYFMATYMAFPFLKPEHSYFRNIPFTLSESLIHLMLQALITYGTLYFILPIYTKQKRVLKAFLLMVACWSLYSLVHFYMTKTGTPALLKWALPEKYVKGTTRPYEMIRYTSLLAVFLGSLSTTIFMASFKYIKQWYLKEQRNIQLHKENTESQLQLLTAQVHPHFLFNTLNNVYSKTQKESPEGSQMIMGLSDLLRYILYEGRKPQVPLDKELQMILEYINLEKIRYGNKLDLHYLVSDKTKDIYIAPLLLLPFVENCFKHGASNILQNPWISLTIEVKDSTLVMKLMNGKANANEIFPMKPGVGIDNVCRRLELLYKGRHELQIREEEEVFIVDLKIELVKIEQLQTVINQPATEILYA